MDCRTDIRLVAEIPAIEERLRVQDADGGRDDLLGDDPVDVTQVVGTKLLAD